MTPTTARLAPLAEAARDAGVDASWSAHRCAAPDGARSLALLGSRPGARPTAYAKQHLWDAERGIFTPATHGATVVLDGWPLGLGICYDGCFPEHARAATDDGALAYVCPSAYVVGSEHRRDLYYAARAIDNGIYW